MNRRRILSLSVGVLAVSLAGADIPSPKPSPSVGGPITVYRAEDAFDPDARTSYSGTRPS